MLAAVLSSSLLCVAGVESIWHERAEQRMGIRMQQDSGDAQSLIKSVLALYPAVPGSANEHRTPTRITPYTLYGGTAVLETTRSNRQDLCELYLGHTRQSTTFSGNLSVNLHLRVKSKVDG